MSLFKKLAVQLVPRTLLAWGKKQYYAYAVPGFWETEVEVVLCLLRPGDSTIDLGANIGWYTALLSRLVGEGGKVYAVEPIPETFDLLSFVTRKLDLTNVDLFNVAVSDRNGSAVMEIPKYEYGGNNHYMARIISGGTSEPALETINVPIRSLDSLLPERLLERVTFVKCDVEGHEVEVLRGAAQFFEKVKPAMMIEVAGTVEVQDAADNELFVILAGFGYVPYWFDGKKLRKRRRGHWSVNYFFLQDAHLPRVAHLVAT